MGPKPQPCPCRNGHDAENSLGRQGVKPSRVALAMRRKMADDDVGEVMASRRRIGDEISDKVSLAAHVLDRAFSSSAAGFVGGLRSQK